MLGGVGDEVSVMPVVYPHVTVWFSSLGFFLSVGFSPKPSHTSLPFSLSQYTIFNSISIIRGVGIENTSGHKRISPGKRSRGSK